MSRDGEDFLVEAFEGDDEFDFDPAEAKTLTWSGILSSEPESTQKKEVDTTTHSQWALGGNNKYSPVGATVKSVPPGIYTTWSQPGVWGLELQNISSDGIYILPDMSTEEVLKDVYKFWDSEAKYLEHGLLFKRGILLFGEPGCLAEDTHVTFQRRAENGTLRNSKGGTIKRLYELFNKIPTPGKGKYQRSVSKDYSFWVSSVTDDGKVVKNRVSGVVKSGIKPCFLLQTVTGQQITATADHKFKRDGQFVPLSTLTVGDRVEVHANKIRNISPRRTRVERDHLYVKYHPTASRKTVAGKYTYHVLPLARAVIEAEMNGLSVTEYKDRLNNRNYTGLRFLNKGDDVHHVDENCLNNVRSNLMVLSHAEHARRHGTQFNDLFFFTEQDVIAAITPVGNKETYDIQMEAPYHNFVADRFVVHNSGKSVTVKILMNEIVKRGGIVILVSAVGLAIEALKAIRRIEGSRHIVCVFEDIDDIIYQNGEANVLSMLDGESNITNVLALATTNYPEKLGARIINRPSRFDRRIYIGMPSDEARKAYLQKATKEGINADDLDLWVKDTKDMSIAHLRELVAAVYCLEQSYVDVIDRLSKMAVQPEGKSGFKSKNKIQFMGATTVASSAPGW